MKSENSKSLNPFKTGDSRNLLRYAVLLSVSGVCVIVLLMKHRKKGREEDA